MEKTEGKQPFKALLIDSAKHEVRECVVADFDQVREFLGGWIDPAWRFANGDVLYVDDEGLLKPQTHFFRISTRDDQPFAGNGVVVGAEILDGEGNLVRMADPGITADALRQAVRFLSRQQAVSWMKGNASEPAVVVTSLGPKGVVTSDVTATWGSLQRDMPEPPDEPEGA